MARSATALMVSVSVALLLAGVGSVTPAGAAMVAVLLMVPLAAPATVALTVTLPPDGSVGTRLRGPCIGATVVLAGIAQSVSLVALAHLRAVHSFPTRRSSDLIAPPAAEGPPLLTTIV